MTGNSGFISSRNSKFERNPKKTIFFVIVISVSILDVVLTNIFLLYTSIIQSEPNPTLGVKNEIYHHDFIKNGSVENEYPILEDRRIKLHTNSLGFKDKSSRRISLLPSKKFKKRIVFIGDSFTEGLMLEYKNTFVGIIDKKLNKKSIEVLNAGVSSYSPIIYWRKIKYLIEDVRLKFDELSVFIDISDFCDEKYRYRLSKRGHVIDQTRYSIDAHWPSKKKSTIRLTDQIKKIIYSQTTLLYHATSAVYDLIKSDSANFSLYQQERIRNLSKLEHCNASWVFKKIDPDMEYSIQKITKYMDKLLQLTRNNNIKLTIAVYPWPYQVLNEDLNSLHVKIWKEWCRKNNVYFINYFPDFISKGLAHKEKIKIVKKYYIPSDVHFNKQGNKLLAKKFLKKYFPDKHF
jgi:lysophospholipase L1-like esterase